MFCNGWRIQRLYFDIRCIFLSGFNRKNNIKILIVPFVLPFVSRKLSYFKINGVTFKDSHDEIPNQTLTF